MNNAKLIYPPQATDSYIPKTLRLDIKYLFDNVTGWRASSKGDQNYKSLAASRGFETEKQIGAIGKKRVDLFKEYDTDELTYRVVIEAETSTIENGYNDLLKIMQLLKTHETDYGVVMFVQNDRLGRAKLTEQELQSNLVKGLKEVLDDFRGKLLIYHIRQIV